MNNIHKNNVIYINWQQYLHKNTPVYITLFIIIVDLVESGETMRAAGLHDVHTLMTTQSVLIANQKSSHADLIKKITSRIRGVIAARKYVLCTYNILRDNIQKGTAVTPGRQGATISSLESHDGWVAVSAMIESKQKGEIMDKLTEVGATDILVTTFSSCRV